MPKPKPKSGPQLVIDNEPKSPVVKIPTDAERQIYSRRLRTTYELLDIGNAKGALAETEKLVKKHPAMVAGECYKALALFRLGRNDDAFALIHKLEARLSVEVFDDCALHGLTQFYQEASLFDRVVKIYEKQVALYPGESSLKKLYLEYGRQTDYDNQMKIALKLNSLFPKNNHFLWLVSCNISQARATKDEKMKTMHYQLAVRRLDKEYKDGCFDEKALALYAQLYEGMNELPKLYKVYSDAIAIKSKALGAPEEIHSKMDRVKGKYDMKGAIEDALQRLAHRPLHDGYWETLYILLRDLPLDEALNYKQGIIERIEDVLENIANHFDCAPDANPEECWQLHWFRARFLNFVREAPDGAWKKLIGHADEVYIAALHALLKTSYKIPYTFITSKDVFSGLSERELSLLREIVCDDAFLEDAGSQESAISYAWAAVLRYQILWAFNWVTDTTRDFVKAFYAEVFEQIGWRKLGPGLFEIRHMPVEIVDMFAKVAGEMMWKEYSENGDEQIVYEFLLLLETLVRPHKDKVADLRVLMLKLYSHLCLMDRTLLMAKRVDVKNGLVDTLGHSLFLQYEQTMNFQAACHKFVSAGQFYDATERELNECIIQEYRQGTLYRIPLLIETASNFKNSINAAYCDMMNRWASTMQFVKGSYDIMSVLAASADELPERFVDSRDVNLQTFRCDAREAEYTEGLLREKERTFHELDCSIRLRDQLMKSVADLGNIKNNGSAKAPEKLNTLASEAKARYPPPPKSAITRMDEFFAIGQKIKEMVGSSRKDVLFKKSADRFLDFDPGTGNASFKSLHSAGEKKETGKNGSDVFEKEKGPEQRKQRDGAKKVADGAVEDVHPRKDRSTGLILATKPVSTSGEELGSARITDDVHVEIDQETEVKPVIEKPTHQDDQGTVDLQASADGVIDGDHQFSDTDSVRTALQLLDVGEIHSEEPQEGHQEENGQQQESDSGRKQKGKKKKSKTVEAGPHSGGDQPTAAEPFGSISDSASLPPDASPENVAVTTADLFDCDEETAEDNAIRTHARFRPDDVARVMFNEGGGMPDNYVKMVRQEVQDIRGLNVTTSGEAAVVFDAAVAIYEKVKVEMAGTELPPAVRSLFDGFHGLIEVFKKTLSEQGGCVTLDDFQAHFKDADSKEKYQGDGAVLQRAAEEWQQALDRDKDVIAGFIERIDAIVYTMRTGQPKKVDVKYPYLEVPNGCNMDDFVNVTAFDFTVDLINCLHARAAGVEYEMKEYELAYSEFVEYADTSSFMQLSQTMRRFSFTTQLLCHSRLALEMFGVGRSREATHAATGKLPPFQHPTAPRKLTPTEIEMWQRVKEFSKQAEQHLYTWAILLTNTYFDRGLCVEWGQDARKTMLQPRKHITDLMNAKHFERTVIGIARRLHGNIIEYEAAHNIK
ncbi:unnamed protein product, partial [Mesorhabditis spiculigera]